MTAKRINNAEINGSKNKKSVALQCAAGGLAESEIQLERILARVPPLIALPRATERCKWTGKSRTGLVELIAPCERNNFKPPVKAIYKRAHKYAQRGQWLIPSENLFRYLLGLAEHSTDEYLATVKARAETKQTKTEAQP